MHRSTMDVYIRDVKHRTTIELDQALLDEAREVLGTTGIRETVERAMRQAIDAELRRQLAAQIRSGEGFDTGPEILAQARPNPLER
jgi:Arc/MetJ family transcription regulator